MCNSYARLVMLASKCCALVNNSRFIVYIYGGPRWLLVFGGLAPGLLQQTQAAPLLPYFPNPKVISSITPGVHDTYVPPQSFTATYFQASPGVVNRGGLSHPLKDVTIL